MGFVLVEGVADGSRWSAREVPFLIKASHFPPGSLGREQVELAIEKWNAQVPHIPLVDKEPHHKDFAEFVQSEGRCRSKTGRRGGRQEIRCHLDTGQNDFGNVMHEIGHCIGLDHEHQRPDRGEFIELIPENIPEDEASQYKIIDDGSFEPIGRYDYDSLMHYPEEFLPRFKVLRLDEQPGAVVGQREKLSAGDVQATLFLYGFRAPRRVTFTATAVGDIRTRNVTLVNHLPRPITIATGPAAKPFKIVKKFPEAAGSFRTVSATVEFRPLNAGKATATWALTIADIPVTVRVSGRGSARIDPQ